MKNQSDLIITKKNIFLILTLSVFIPFHFTFAQEDSVSLSEDSNNGSNETVYKSEFTKTKKEDKTERIKVTGSHIKRIDIEGASPIKVIDREQLDKSGYNSVSDVLRDTTVNSFGSAREDSGSNAAGVAHVNLRGLGSASTLVLLNGHRLPTDGVTGAVDLNLIPMAAVERIDILKDGASATYGSDALGGVVNIITREDFSGTEFKYQDTSTSKPGGKKMEVSVVNGVTKSNFNMVNVIHYRENATVLSKDRFFTANGISPTGSPGSYREINSDGTVGPWVHDPDCPIERIEVLPNGRGTKCTFKFSDFSTEIPALQQVSVMSESQLKVTPSTQLKFRVGATEMNSKWAYAPAPDGFLVDSQTAQNMGIPVTPGNQVQIAYRLTELGNRDTEVKSKSYNALLGSSIEVGETWEVEVDTSYNHINRIDKGVNGYALRDRVNEAVSTGSFNPTASQGQRGSLNQARYVPFEDVTSELFSTNILASGEITEWAAGPLSLAIGSTYTFEKFKDILDEESAAGNVYGSAGSSGGGHRISRAAFTELSMPVTEYFEVQLAGRYDKFSDFGDTFNPKLGLRLQASKSLLFRASAGSGFKAPKMQDLYAAASEGYPTFIDNVACLIEKKAGGETPSCSPGQYLVTSGGNPHLKEEKSISYNLGAVFQPSRGFHMTSDIWLTKLNNVTGVSYEDITKAELKGIDVSQYGVVVDRDNNGYINSIKTPLQNLSAQEAHGVDIGIGGNVGKFNYGIEHSHMIHFKQEGFPGVGFEDILGDNGYPVWKNSVSLGMNITPKFNLTVSANTISDHKKAVKEKGSLSKYTSTDVQASYLVGKTEFVGGVKNLEGSTPPLDDSNPNNQLDVDMYDQIGRRLYLGMKASF